MPRPVALVSCAEARHHDHDLAPIVRALADRGRQSDIVDWDDAGVDWADYEAAIVRSPWDYHHRLDEFLAWLNRAASVTTVMNGVEHITWNTNKTYLGEMAAAGVAVIPTSYIVDAAGLDDAGGSLDGDIVVKPTVSAGANNTRRHVDDAAGARAHVAELLAMGKHAMVQPYQRFIDERGETGLVYFNATFSHAFRKGPILATGDASMNGLFVEEEITPRRPNDQERELGDAVVDFLVAKFGEAPLYARVDMVRGSAGVPVLMELEITEPSFFLHTSADAASRFASAVLGRL